MKAEEKIFVNSRAVSCDGGTPELGHPLVYLNIKDNEKSVLCPYCSKEFVFKKK